YDKNKRLCSGAYDYKRDGCPDTYGWVADLVNGGFALPQEMLCPTNPLKGSEKLNDMVGVTDSVGSTGRLPNDLTFRLSEGNCTPSGILAGSPDTETRGAAVADYLLSRGYGSNYVSSWFLVRSAVKLASNSSSGVDLTMNASDCKGLKGGQGPLTIPMVETSQVATQAIPLLGDGAPGDVHEAVLSQTIPGFIVAGERLVEAFNDGPAHVASDDIDLIDDTDVILDATTGVHAWAFDILPTPETPAGVDIGTDGGAAGSGDNTIWLQDTRDWMALHGGGAKLNCNLLMADGSVINVIDENGDSFLNPGFQGSFDSGDGYLDGTVELTPTQCYSGASIERFATIKGSFE
ncbi:Putative major pilin subunit, partial [Durusdinium trenchii]